MDSNVFIEALEKQTLYFSPHFYKVAHSLRNTCYLLICHAWKFEPKHCATYSQHDEPHEESHQTRSEQQTELKHERGNKKGN